MKRRNFIQLLPTAPLALQPELTKPSTQPFVIRASDDRFHEHLKVGGVESRWLVCLYL